MKMPPSMPRLKGYRYPREVIAFAVWAYCRFALSTADVEDLLAERGVIVSREAIRLWVHRFGAHFADCIKRDRPAAADKWHLDEFVIQMNGKNYWLWRAVDSNGDVLDIFVQNRRNAKAATGRRDDEKRSWAGSNHLAKQNVSSPATIKLTQFFAPAVTA